MASHKLSEEARKLYNEKRRATMLERYGDIHYNNKEKNRATKIARYGNPNYNNLAKREQTCMERYGVPHQSKLESVRNKIRDKKLSPETQAKYESTCMKRYGVSNINLSPEIRAKYLKTLNAHYNTSSPLQNAEVKRRQVQSMRENGSFKKSKGEDHVYQYLCSLYGEKDVIRQYVDPERYPFNCDFYIKSKDLFIECNFHWTHGRHPFNMDDPEDARLLDKWKSKAQDSKFYRNAIDVWTRRDIDKIKAATTHNLNYKAYYKIEEIIMKTV